MAYDPQNDGEVTLTIECGNFEECGFCEEVTIPCNDDTAFFECPTCGWDDSFSIREHFDWLHADDAYDAMREEW